MQADGKIVVGRETGSNTGSVLDIYRLNSNGSLDPTFNVGGYGYSGTGYGGVSCLTMQPDGKILVGNRYGTYNGISVPSGITRLNSNGTIDATFNPGGGGFNNVVNCFVLQPDGKIIVGGGFSIYNNNAGVPDGLLRLNANGIVDNTFNLGGTGFANSATPGGSANWEVYGLALQSDGKVLVGNRASYYNSDPNVPDALLRINANGTWDQTFNQGGSGYLIPAGTPVYAVAVQPDGKIIAGGTGNTYNSAPTNSDGIQRFNADGTLNGVDVPLSGASYVFTPGNTTTNPLVTSTGGLYSAVATYQGVASAPSNVVTVTTCPAPVLSSLSRTSGPVGTSVTLTGTNLASATSVRFNGTAQTTITANTATSLTVNVPVGTTTGPVTVVTAGGTSNGLAFTVTTGTATATNDLARQIAVYPNPATGAVFVELPVALRGHAAAATLVDALGRVASQYALPAGLESHSLSLAGVVPGLYALRVQADGGTLVYKLLVN